MDLAFLSTKVPFLRQAQSGPQSGRENNANQAYTLLTDMPRRISSNNNELSVTASTRFDKKLFAGEGPSLYLPVSPKVTELIEESQWRYTTVQNRRDECKAVVEAAGEANCWAAERDLLRQRVDQAQREREKWEQELDESMQNLQMARRRADDLQRRVDSNQKDLERLKRELNSKVKLCFKLKDCSNQVAM